MRRKQLGETGLMVSEIGFGGIPITRLSVREAARLVKYGHDQGINLPVSEMIQESLDHYRRFCEIHGQ